MVIFINLLIVIVLGMGLNVYFFYFVVKVYEGMIFVIVFFVVFVVGMILILLLFIFFCIKLMEVIFENLKYVIIVGIGLFIVFIGLCLIGIVIKNDVNLVGFGDFYFVLVLLVLVGFGIIIVFMFLNVNGVLFIGMLLIGIIVFFMG